jgi:hypothetical protein
MKYIQTFENFINEGKRVIYPKMDNSVKTPYGKGGPIRTVILGKTSSGLAVTLNGDFVDGNKYIVNPTTKDKEESKEMIQFHHNRLSGGIAKATLSNALQRLESLTNEAKKDESTLGGDDKDLA